MLPVAALSVPAAHTIAEVAPAVLEYEPRGARAQDVAPEAPENEPAAHKLEPVEPAADPEDE